MDVQVFVSLEGDHSPSSDALEVDHRSEGGLYSRPPECDSRHVVK